MRPAAVFGDGMVLQREKPVRVFGETDQALPVVAEIDGLRAQAIPSGGRFLITLPPHPAGGPYALNISQGEARASFAGVYYGEVWLCGGQSNMEFRLMEDREAEAVMRKGHPLVRYYVTPECGWLDDAALARERETRWHPLAPGMGGELSAVGCFAGMAMADALQVHVGLIACSVGGTPAVCWMNPERLAALPQADPFVREFEENAKGVTDEEYDRAVVDYQRRADAWGEAQAALRRENPAISQGEVEQRLGPFPWPPPWGRKMPRRPGGLYESMLLRAAPMAMRGFLYYQGETDSAPERAPGYAALLTALIAQWREAYKDDALWFLLCQLPRFGADPACEDWPAIRAAQRRVADAVPRCEMACLIDCGDCDDLHPKEKRKPGERLAALALRHVYGMDVPADAPRVASARVDGNVVRLAVRNAGGALTVQGDAGFACEGAKIISVTAQGEEIAVTLDAPPAQGRLLYAQENCPEATIFGASGLPLEPFAARIAGGEATIE